MPVAHTLTRKHDGFDDGTGRGTPIVPEVCGTLSDGAHYGGGLNGQDAYTGRVIPAIPFDTTQATHPANRSKPKLGDPCHPLAAGAHPPAVAFSVKDYGADAVEGLSPTLRAGGHNTSHANGGVMPAVAYGINARQDPDVYEGRTGPIDTDGSTQAVAFNPTQSAKARSMGESVEVAPTMGAQLHAAVAQVQWSSGGGKVENDTAQTLRSGAEHNYQFARIGMAVRRLTPTECERLQGFPDGWTNVPWRKKDEAPDGPRYKALGNSMAVNVMRWIGDRIAEVEAIEQS